jgi:hypothetical protein
MTWVQYPLFWSSEIELFPKITVINQRSNPNDPQVFGPPGSGSFHQEKVVRKPLI